MGQFVAAGEAAKQFKKIDPGAVVDWDTKVLRVTVNKQKFSLFPARDVIVVNGTIEKLPDKLRIYQGEIYLPQSAMDRIGKTLEDAARGGAEKTPTPTPTTTPDVTEPQASPSPEPTVSAEPTTTPAPTPSATPTAAPSPSPLPTAPPTPTPTPTPTPSPTPVATRTPRPARTPREQPLPAPAVIIGKAPARPYAYEQALRDTVEARGGQLRITQRKESDLQAVAGQTRLQKVVLDPDDGAVGRSPSGTDISALTLDIARKVQTRLQAQNIQVELTRNAVGRVTPGKKLEIITNSGAQALVSIRVDSNRFAEASGFCVYFVNDTVDYYTGRTVEKDPGDLVPLELSYRPFGECNKLLAASLLSSLGKVISKEAGTMSPSPLFLARRAPMASAMVSLGYITNPVDAKRLTAEASQDAAAQAIADAITQFGAQMCSPSATAAASRPPEVAR